LNGAVVVVDGATKAVATCGVVKRRFNKQIDIMMIKTAMRMDCRRGVVGAVTR
jgi:hypothetical protein